jgi:acyl carrier protein
MTEQEFKEKMLDVLNREEEVELDTNLNDVEEWDSLAYIAFLTMTADCTDKVIRATQVRNAQTMRDLYELIVKD